MLKPGDPDYEFEQRELLREARIDRDMDEYLRNWCQVCDGPMLGSHYHESEEDDEFEDEIHQG